MASPPFSACPTDIGPATLAPIKPREVEPLVQAMAEIDPWKRMRYPLQAMRDYFARQDPALTRYAIRVDGALSGTAAFRYPWLKGPYLELLAVLPPAQGKGVGGAVLDWMEKEVAGRERNLWVLASDFNVSAIRFYERHGFVRVTPLHDVAADGFTEILLRKVLA